ncbi:MAG TPA: glycoside hydrolase family 2 TIM barrel-domain containing protein [Syntrophomonadaceae bacterium]|nr:glycoside hydrolase family 2 TIM barrel-domain containing protein [Syntrophomonadaceae bacterium]
MLNNFTLGVNYWPINKAMYWWRNFDAQEVRRDFARLSQYNIKYIRIFLTWEDFQPEAQVISPLMLDYLKNTADLAATYKLKLMPTFFCGHMSGANWMPKWMIEPSSAPSRFPLYSGNGITKGQIKNFYKAEEILAAQVLQISKVCRSLKNHPAVCAYDLGNESSNCYVPSSCAQGQNWLKLLTDAVRENTNLPVTYGIHAEDLEENRNIGPLEVAKYCDFVVMHAYPFYLSWTDNPFDVWVLPFLGTITKWLAGKPVLLQEFGAPSIPTIPPYLSEEEKKQLKCPIWTEREVKEYYTTSLSLLHEAGMLGAWAWCYGDYAPHLWNKTPLKQNYHERYFGLFRSDGSPKLAAQVFKDRGKLGVKHIDGESPTWLRDFKPDEFYFNPLKNLQILYQTYKKYLQNKEKK